MRPFLLLSIRPEREAADDEYAAFLRFTGLEESTLQRVQLSADRLPDLDLGDWSGVILGGGPLNASDPVKSPLQQRIEHELDGLLREVIERDVAFLGACYGIGALGTHVGAVVDTAYAEPVGATEVELTEEGLADPLMAGLPGRFAAYGGHKEAISRLPERATLLASGPTCPVQAFRVGRRVYATQFHPELDLAGLCTRIDVYRDAGYFPSEDAEALQAQAGLVEVEHPTRMLANFVTLAAR